MIKNLKTTLSHYGVVSSFKCHGVNYIVSTVKDNVGYETVLKKEGNFKDLICSVGAIGSRHGVANHISVTRMAISSEPRDWNKENIGLFYPKIIFQEISKMNLEYDSNNMQCEFCDTFLRMSGIGYIDIKNISWGDVFKEQLIIWIAVAVVAICIFMFI